MVKLSGKLPFAHQQPSGSRRRGRIRGFSKGSRKRLMVLLNSIDKSRVDLPIFITLTYHYPVHLSKAKRDLDTLMKRFSRRWAKYSCIWRMEPQKRGVAHFHLLLFGVRWVDAAWLARTWVSVAKGDDAMLKASVRVERVRSWRGVKSYCSKYMGKVSSSSYLDPDQYDDGVLVEYTGRQWGVYGRANLPIEWRCVALDWRVWWRVRRLVKCYASSHGWSLRYASGCAGATVFLPWEFSLKLWEFLDVRVPSSSSSAAAINRVLQSSGVSQ